MKAKHGEAFATVAPQGRKGDGGNDGYLPSTSHYFQLYAPISPKEKVATAAKKVKADFAKIKKAWGTKENKMSRFSFVFNDKYEGAPNDVEQALNELRAKNAAIAFAQYCCRDLEADFMADLRHGVGPHSRSVGSRSSPDWQSRLFGAGGGNPFHHVYGY